MQTKYTATKLLEDVVADYMNMISYKEDLPPMSTVKDLRNELILCAYHLTDSMSEAAALLEVNRSTYVEMFRKIKGY